MGNIYIEQRLIDNPFPANNIAEHFYLVYKPHEDAPIDTWRTISAYAALSGEPWGALITEIGSESHIDRPMSSIWFENREKAFSEGYSMEYYNIDPDNGDVLETPAGHGSRLIASGATADSLWQQMKNVAALIGAQNYAYEPYNLTEFALPPTLNSNSFIGSLLYHFNIDINDNLPLGGGVAPGYKMILGLGVDEEFTVDDSFYKFNAGGGDDTLRAIDAQSSLLLGGAGADIFVISGGEDHVVHGENGGAQVLSAGLDVVDYSQSTNPLDISFHFNEIDVDGHSNDVPLAYVERTSATGVGDVLYSVESIRATTKADYVNFTELSEDEFANLTIAIDGNTSTGGDIGADEQDVIDFSGLTGTGNILPDLRCPYL